MKKHIILIGFILLTFFWNTSSAQKVNIKERKKTVSTIVDLAEEHMANPSFLASKEWGVFKKKIKKKSFLRLPLEDFRKAFKASAKALPFSHFYLWYKKEAMPDQLSSSINARPSMELKEVDENTVQFVINSFDMSAMEMAQMVGQIQAKGYKNLIIDLRNNGGGSLDGAVVLGQYLTDQMIDAGVYLSKNWFQAHKGYPTMEEIQQFPYLQDMSFAGFAKMLDSTQGFRMVLPPHNRPVFKGAVYVLTSRFTASTCEPFVALLKESQVATIVGKTTAGEMLSGRYFSVNDQLKLFLPVADYLTAHGTKIDKVGVAPNVDIDDEKALDYVLKNLTQ